MKTELNDENLLFWLECRKFVDLKDPKAVRLFGWRHILLNF